MTTVLDVQRFKDEGRRFAVLTAYDFLSARILDEAGIPILLVGDSLGMVMLGHPTTLPVTMDDMLHHAKAVARGARQALLVGDMPFMSYQAATEDAIRNAGRFMQEAGMHAVKLEGVPSKLAATITHRLRIPTIGIGAGPGTDGQVLVLHDMLGLTTGKAPKFVKRYASLAEEIARAATAYSEDVRTGKFPGPEHEYTANGSGPATDSTRRGSPRPRGEASEFVGSEEVRYGG